MRLSVLLNPPCPFSSILWFGFISPSSLDIHSDKVYLKERGFTEVISSTLPLQLRMEKGEIEKKAGRRAGETIELYPKEGLMTIYSEKFSDKELENGVGKSLMHCDKFSDK